MRTIFLTLFVSSVGVLPLPAQLNSLHNRYRHDDMLIKQQVECVDPGKAGANQIWNFSNLRTIHDEYVLAYGPPPLEGDSVYILGGTRYLKKKVSENELIVGTEHNTMYYYHLTGDSLLQTGHENPSVKMEYISPIVLMQFPLNYGQTITSSYKSKGLYSGTINIQSEGIIRTTADALGKLILPSGDTLSPVLRVKTEQTILDVPNEYSYNTDENNKGKLLETCRWYSKGYRYPVFETVRNINIADSVIVFSTAFFYPPQDHLYLDTDPENQALLDKLWKEAEANPSNTQHKDGKTVALEDIMTCEIYPNPVVSHISLQYELKQDANVSFELCSIEGFPIKKISPKSRTIGIYHETIDCSSLESRNYVLRVSANNAFVNEIIIKK